MKTVYTKNKNGSVTLAWDCPYTGDRFEETYSLVGTHVVVEDGRQVCEKLLRRGPTLRGSKETLLAVIKREFARRRRDAIKELSR